MEEPMHDPKSVAISNITVDERIRKDYGDIDALCKSIREFGLIQPIVLQRRDGDTDGRYVLVAGGRRLAAMSKIGYRELAHGKEFVWRDEDLSAPTGILRLQAVELEENLQRHDLHWSEVVLAKSKLLDTMRAIHGTSKGFGAGRTGASGDGFGIRTLAAMLGENPSTTSRDIDLAQYVAKHPMLAKLPTRADAQRKLGVAVTVAVMQNLAAKSVVQPSAGATPQVATVGAGEQRPGSPAPALSQPERWKLYEGPFQENIPLIDDNSVDLVLTDLPYNIGLGDSSASHSAGLGNFSDRDLDISALCRDVATESFRVLRPDRFAVFFFGFAYYNILKSELETSGFTVDTYPFIWLRDRTAPPDGYARYSKTYDPALIASKGTPRFIRPNLPNSISIPSVRGPERLHAAQKPIGIMEKFILDMTTPDCIVLDMFAGAGTTGAAALKNKRQAILFELEPANCVVIRSRMGAI